MSEPNTIDQLIERFNLYRSTQPNIANCWISYLGLKKRHYGAFLHPSLLRHCQHVLQSLSECHYYLSNDDLFRLTIYKYIINT